MTINYLRISFKQSKTSNSLSTNNDPNISVILKSNSSYISVEKYRWPPTWYEMVILFTRTSFSLACSETWAEIKICEIWYLMFCMCTVKVNQVTHTKWIWFSFCNISSSSFWTWSSFREYFRIHTTTTKKIYTNCSLFNNNLFVQEEIKSASFKIVANFFLSNVRIRKLTQQWRLILCAGRFI